MSPTTPAAVRRFYARTAAAFTPKPAAKGTQAPAPLPTLQVFNQL